MRSVGPGQQDKEKAAKNINPDNLHSYVMGETKFIEFTEQEFQHFFTGLKTLASNSRNEHSKYFHE